MASRALTEASAPETPGGGPDTEPVDLDALTRAILEDPEKANDPSIPMEHIEEVLRRITPYSGVIGTPPAAGRRALIACSFTNLREDYLRRFTMTSLVGFVFQALAEWEVPEKRRRWVPAKQRSEGPMPAAELAAKLRDALKIAEEAAVAAAPPKAGPAPRAGPGAEGGDEKSGPGGGEKSSPGPGLGDSGEKSRPGLGDSGEKSSPGPGLGDGDEKSSPGPGLGSGPGEPGPAGQPGPGREARAAALAYTAAHVVHRLGAEAGRSLRPAWKAAQRFPEVREALEQYPVPAPPSEQTIPPAVAKAVIEDFLKNWLEFDPTIHVRCAHDGKAFEKSVAELAELKEADRKAAAERLTPEALRAPPAPAAEHAKALAKIRAAGLDSAVLALLGDPELQAAVGAAQAAPEAFAAYLAAPPKGDPARPALDRVPPQDTFHRWKFYTDVNFERLRKITSALYDDQPDLDFAIAPWQYFEGPEAEADKWFKEFCRRWEDKTPSSICSVEVGRGWTLLGEFAKNRDRSEIFTRRTEILEKIIRRHEEDQKIGAQLMKKRIKVKKAENIRKDGPDAEGLASYRQSQASAGQGLDARGATGLTPEEAADLKAARGSLPRAEELALLREYRETIKRLGAAEKDRTLSFDEARDLQIARTHIARAEEMARVPADAVQIDVFQTDGRTGDFKRSVVYTEAEAPEAEPGAGPGAGGGSEHPAVRAQGGPARRGQPRPGARAPEPQGRGGA